MNRNFPDRSFALVPVVVESEIAASPIALCEYYRTLNGLLAYDLYH